MNGYEYICGTAARFRKKFPNLYEGKDIFRNGLISYHIQTQNSYGKMVTEVSWY